MGKCTVVCVWRLGHLLSGSDSGSSEPASEAPSSSDNLHLLPVQERAARLEAVRLERRAQSVNGRSKISNYDKYQRSGELPYPPDDLPAAAAESERAPHGGVLEVLLAAELRRDLDVLHLRR